MADGDEPQAPAPARGGNGAEGAERPAAGPGGFPVGGLPPGQGLRAPTFTSRDPSDPLSPEKLRESELSVEQSIAFFARLKRVARNPGAEPGFRQVIASLVHYQALYRDLNALAEAAYNRAVRVRDLIAKLDMSSLANIQAFASAAEDADKALFTWQRVYSTYEEIHKSLHGGDAVVVAAAPQSRQIGDLTA